MHIIISTKMNDFCRRTLSDYEFLQNFQKGICANIFPVEVHMDLQNDIFVAAYILHATVRYSVRNQRYVQNTAL